MSNRVEHDLVVQLHIVNLIVDKAVPIIRQHFVEILVTLQAMAFRVPQVRVRWDHIDRVAGDDDHLGCRERLLSEARVLREVRLSDPDLVRLARDVLTK